MSGLPAGIFSPEGPSLGLRTDVFPTERGQQIEQA
jgi:hypothetical protein